MGSCLQRGIFCVAPATLLDRYNLAPAYGPASLTLCRAGNPDPGTEQTQGRPHLQVGLGPPCMPPPAAPTAATPPLPPSLTCLPARPFLHTPTPLSAC
jgi:hypothetical protein